MIKKFTQGDPSYLLAVCEGPGPVFGVAFVDTTLVSLVTLVASLLCPVSYVLCPGGPGLPPVSGVSCPCVLVLCLIYCPKFCKIWQFCKIFSKTGVKSNYLVAALMCPVPCVLVPLSSGLSLVPS